MKQFFKYVKEFGFGFTVKYYFYTIVEKMFKNKKDLKNNLVRKYLNKNYKSIIVDQVISPEVNCENDKIWVFWWTGLDTAPEIVKICVSKLKEASPSNNVIVLDRNNIKDYIDIPQYIYDKLDKGMITITHFSDILRMCLLSKHGGMWVDATIYYSGNNIERYLGKEFYTIKHLEGNGEYISNNRWTGYFLCCKKDNLLTVNVRNILFEYWKRHNLLIEYFLIDFLIELVYFNNSKVKEMIDSLDCNNENNEKLVTLLNCQYDENVFNELKSNTEVFKLTWKSQFKDVDDGKKTFYGHIKGE